ncbi:MAG: hypothetical protein GXO11_06845 [Epsilonproteobacteria bacterium]|nr:hypothetical protein [Campylobacterota bacterium]
MQMQQECYTPEDEIDLKELWQTIKKGKKTIFITMFVIVSLTFVYVLSIPNTYKSSAVLIPSASKGSSLGSLGGLAAMAGVSFGSGGDITPDVAFSTLLKDEGFMKQFIQKNHLIELFENSQKESHYVFAFGFRGLYDFFHSSKKEEEESQEDKIYNLMQKLQKGLSISADKQSGLITISYSDYDRFLAPKIVEMFLNDASAYLVKNSLENIESRLHYFEKEIRKVESFELRTALSQMISKILQEKVMIKSKRYYKADLLTAPEVAYVKNKTKPKRGLILVVSFITSLILGIFLVFFLEFLKNNENELETNAAQSKD